ncbi:hypothetical protein ASQ44_03795 [Rickettsia rhipicephali]|uniref:hypothetical protein n=1 Tax=Rickettsia rhipicephali TaxID=33992 RepID=UPI000710C025|nr:hypothetical protein [Rickettsia rhipicephali]ALN41248.1 hypothetical protein ASQ44_03795 [Rickettsia rhipicephali]
MTKRKLDCVIKESIQINTINKKSKLVDDAEKYSTNQNSYMLTNTELYSNKNIKLILLHHMQDKVIDVDIFDYDVNKEKEEQWNKQQKKLIKKLKFDLYKFESSQLTEKFYILGQKDNNAIITAASIIRFFKQDDELIIDVIPVILHKYSRSIYNDLNMQSVLDDIAIDILCTRRSGTLIKSEGINIGKFIEVIKLRINNIDNPVSIDEDIKKVIEVPSSNYKIAHQEIVDKYKIEFQNNEGQGNYSSEEDEILDVIDQIKDTIEYEEIICEVVEQLITRAVKKSEKGEKNLSWDISVVDNEGRTRNNKEVKLNDREAIEIFAKALEKWDLELFKEAKDKSKDFAKLVDYFNEEIKHEFWGHFFEHCYYKRSLNDPKLSHQKKREIEKEYDINVFQGLDGYVFLIKNVPNLLDQLRAKQCSIIRDLPEDRQKDRPKDLVELIESKISAVDSSRDANNDQVMGMINLTNGDLQGIKQDNTEQNKLDEKENESTSLIINTESNILCVENATQENIALSLIGNIE